MTEIGEIGLYAGLYAGLGGALLVAGLVQVVKVALALSDTVWKRFMPLIALVLGVGWNALVASQADDIPMSWNVIILGIFAGLSAAGLYSGQKAVRGK